MNQATRIIIAVVVVAAVAAGALLLVKKSDKTGENPPPLSNENKTLTITYDGTNFVPAEMTIKFGDMVKIVNQSDKEMELASNPHPVHTDNPELNQGDIEAGQSKEFSLTTKGSWGYHNHYNPISLGKITVE